MRVITHAIRANRGPFRNITAGGRHIHHLTFGITSLLTVGYLWLLEIGTNEQRQASRITSIAYGSGAALTLDEFALWLNLADDYWTKQGRESIDAVALFGSLLVPPPVTLLAFMPVAASRSRLGLPTEHTSLTEWEWGSGNWRLVRYNDAAHLRTRRW